MIAVYVLVVMLIWMIAVYVLVVMLIWMNAVYVLVLVTRMNVVFVMMIQPMIVPRIVMRTGVALLQKIAAAYVLSVIHV